MDGSSKDFLQILKSTKLSTLTKKRKYLKVLDKIELVDGERKISIEPDDSSLEVDFQLDYENLIIGKQRNKIDLNNDNLNDIVNSRTFCLHQDIEKIKKAGLAKGGSLDNAIVVDENKVLNKEGLRNDKEFVNHKILDLAGDFLLSGYRIVGKVKCYQGGHELTNLFLRKMLDQTKLLKIFEMNNVFISKRLKSNPFVKLAVNA
jgi:UDP-3-O-[3-hydroxymyristoyl] N-acetylglucosamine deacetylase